MKTSPFGSPTEGQLQFYQGELMQEPKMEPSVFRRAAMC